jgi:hypothetical protein
MPIEGHFVISIFEKSAEGQKKRFDVKKNKNMLLSVVFIRTGQFLSFCPYTNFFTKNALKK